MLTVINFLICNTMIRRMISMALCLVLAATYLLIFSAETSAALTLSEEEKNWIKQNPDKLVLWYQYLRH
jgi:hypothetical protein